jgi:hypothetical protein
MWAVKAWVITAESFFEEFIPDVFDEIREVYAEEIAMGKLDNSMVRSYFHDVFFHILENEKVEEVIIWNRSGRYRIPEVVEIENSNEFLRWVEWSFGKYLIDYVVPESEEEYVISEEEPEEEDEYEEDEYGEDGYEED